MPSLFAALGAVAGATVDAVFSEAFILEPMAAPASVDGRPTDVNARRVPSSARAGLSFFGTYVAPGDLMNAHGRTKADATTHAIAGEKALIDIPVDALSQRPHDGDRITRLDTGEIFEVAKVLPGDFGRLRIFVTDAQRRSSAPR